MRLLSYETGIMTNLDGGEKSLSIPRYRKKTKWTPGTRAIQPVDKFQIEIVRHLEVVCPHCFVFCTDNAGNHIKYQWEVRLEMGLKPGLPGICLLAPVKGHWEPHFIRPMVLGQLESPAEESQKLKLITRGIKQAAVTSLADVKEALLFWQIETRDLRIT